jgi:hypothetical protein
VARNVHLTRAVSGAVPRHHDPPGHPEQGEVMRSRVRSIVAGAVAGALGVTEAAAQTTDLVSANGCAVIADASGGDYKFAIVS